MKNVLTKIIASLIGLGIIGGLFGVGILLYFSFSLPKITSLADYRPPIPSKILAKDGTVLAEIALERREIAKFEDIPKRIVDAFLSAEDSGFYEHAGVDYLGVLRALIANLKAGRVVQGGSTITQQVAKSLLLTRERSISRKIKDFLLAQKIEEKFSKREILFLYLNQVYLGGGYYGVKTAFQGYFGKDLSEASISEAAMVAGLLVAPGKYSPYVNPSRAKSRQGYVLKRMRDTGKISKEEYKEALAEKIQYRLRLSREFKAGYFTEWVRQRVTSLVGEEEFKTNGYIIQTTLDWELQQTAEKEIIKGVKAIDKRQGYKGVLGTINEENIKEFLKNQRIDIYRDVSTYFTLSEEKKRVYEIELSEKEMELQETSNAEFRKIISSSKYRAGYDSKDPLLKILKKNGSYEAIVEHVDNDFRLIYINIAGIVGIIPYSGFRWAHERKVEVNKNYYSHITRPSRIVKKGDKILVSILKTRSKILKLAEGSFDKRYKKLEVKERRLIRSQSYLHCILDQEADAQSALVSINPFSGELVSLVGGKDFIKSKFNRAIQSRRQPGSAFKPLLFAAGLENKFTPSSIIIDSPETLGGVDDSLNWKPRNYDGKFKGPITYRNSLEQSRNVPTIKIASELGVPLIKGFMDRIGFRASLDPDLSLALGSFGVTLIDIVSTYSIFPNGGKKVKPKTILSIIDRDGSPIAFDSVEYLGSKDQLSVEEIEEKGKKEDEKLAKLEDQSSDIKKNDSENKNPYLMSLDGDQVYDPRLSYIMTNLLRGVVLHGTGRSAREISTFLGGKTGTTNNYVDAWFLGFSSNLVTGVWTGFDDNQTLGWGETGTKSALPIWKEFMRHGLRKYGEHDFKQPIGIVNVLIDKSTGKQASLGGKTFMEAFIEGTEPGAKKEANLFKEDNEEESSSSNSVFDEEEYYQSQ